MTEPDVAFQNALLLGQELRERIYLFYFKDKLGFYQILTWWEHLGRGYAGHA